MDCSQENFDDDLLNIASSLKRLKSFRAACSNIGRIALACSTKEDFNRLYFSALKSKIFSIADYFIFVCDHVNDGEGLAFIAGDFNEIKPFDVFGLQPALCLELGNINVIVWCGTGKRKPIRKMCGGGIPVFLNPSVKIASDDFLRTLT